MNLTNHEQSIPIAIQSVSPTIARDEIVLAMESLVEKEMVINFYNTLGKVVKTETRHIEIGINRLNFNVRHEKSGMYFIQTSEGYGRNMPLKFMKM